MVSCSAHANMKRRQPEPESNGAQRLTPTEEDFIEPDLFRSNGKRYDCIACGALGLSLQKALSHEAGVKHTMHVRKLDGQMFSDPFGPGDASPHVPGFSSPASRESSPLPPSSPLDRYWRSGHAAAAPPEQGLGVEFDLSSSPLAGAASPPSTHRVGYGTPSDQAGHSLQDFERDRPFTIHGPQLPSDPPDQIFDNWGGRLGRSSPLTRVSERPASPVDPFTASIIDRALPDTGKDDSSGSEDGWDGIEFSDPFDFVPPHESCTENDADPELDEDEEWWPWRNKKECLLDSLGAFPRAAFSEAEMEVTRWFAEELGVSNLPSVRVVKEHRKFVLGMAGSSPTVVKSSLGNFYCKTSLASILAHEMANPLVRKQVHFYPESSFPQLAEARQAERWLCEADPKYAGIMARDAVGKQDYFVYEPCLAMINDRATPVMPVRFFTKAGQMHAQVHRLSSSSGGLIIEAASASDSFELELSKLTLSYPRLLESHAAYGLPSPHNILGIRLSSGDCPLATWDLPALNPWRGKAQGRRVLSLPLWMYCDDTSGNSSKKWNKHNSFLFVLAGLPREEVHRAYNIHFLSTSNIASPLEMLEGIAADMAYLQEHGLAAWDCQFREEVLYIPWPFAFLGDNPMQSELASHIGMTGKFFCRVCHGGEKHTGKGAPPSSEAYRLLSQFLSAGEPRTRLHTITELRKQWNCLTEGHPSQVDATATQSGVKDKHLIAFIERFSAEINKRKDQNRANGRPASYRLQETINELLDGRAPEDLFNPMLRLDGIDPNADTPVEILHVVLLGFVKYFWRDAVSRQNAAGKRTLKARLSSVNVADLGLSAIQGSTLVQYAKSLTGRDFRVIAQVAPAVLHGLVPDDAYEAWLALCRLCPLIFQPEISDVNAYLDSLQAAVDDFLAATALWTTQWFNKPKFHVLIHIIFHIRRFGPAILMATEGFESYNFVIRSRSILSNRHAPSKDIAHAMSFMHSVRHLVSGGWVWLEDRAMYRQAGKGVRELVRNAVFMKLMGMSSLNGLDAARSVRTQACKGMRPVAWDQTRSAVAARSHSPTGHPGDISPSATLLVPCETVTLPTTDDTARLDGFVAFRSADGMLALGRIHEILAPTEKLVEANVMVLIQQWAIGPCVSPYRMPAVSPTDCWSCLHIESVVCAVHTFHNCYRNGCTATATRVVRQERQETELRDDELLHDAAPDDLVLNLAKMRSSQYIRCFAPEVRYPNMSLASVIPLAMAKRSSIASMPAPALQSKRRRTTVEPATRSATPAGAPPLASFSTLDSPWRTPLTVPFDFQQIASQDFPQTPPRRRTASYHSFTPTYTPSLHGPQTPSAGTSSLLFGNEQESEQMTYGLTRGDNDYTDF